MEMTRERMAPVSELSSRTKPKRRDLLTTIHVLLERLKSSDEQASFDAARQIAELNSRAATRTIMRVAKTAAHVHSRRFAIFVLRRLSDRRSVRLLSSLLGSQEEPEGIRDEAAEALSVFAEKRSRLATEALLSARGDASAAVRFSVAYSLGFCNDSRCRRALLDLQRDNAVTQSANTSVGEMARQSLENLQRTKELRTV